MITCNNMDSIFQALAHTTRRRIMDIVKNNPGIGVGALAKSFDVSRIAIMNHLAVIEKADLIISERDGRIRRLYLNAAPIQLIYDRWTDEYSGYWAQRMSDIKYKTEKTAGKRET